MRPGVVLGDEFHVARAALAIGTLVLQAQVGQ
jgi:hypothetical protein